MQLIIGIHASRAQENHGLALLEVIAALLVLSAGVLGVLWQQQLAWVRQQQHNQQSIAMGLADDIAERMRLNNTQSGLYALGWGEQRTSGQNCFANPCNWIELAQWDMSEWQKSLYQQLPKGDAAIWPLQGFSGWWGISVGWPDPSKANGAYANTDITQTVNLYCPKRMQCWGLLVRPKR